MSDVPTPVPSVDAAAALDPSNFPLSKEKWFQVLDHCWRPGGGWAVLIATIFGLIIGPIFLDKHLNDGEMWALVGLFIGMWGLKTFERTKAAPTV